MRTVRKRASRPGPRRTRTRGDAAVTRERLVAAAADIFNREGYHATDSNRIARAAGYAPAMFYRHFGDKREIFLAAYARWVGTEWEQIREQWKRQLGRAAATRRIVALVLEHHRRWAGFRRSLRALADADEGVRAFRLEQRALQLKFLRSLDIGRDGARGRAEGLFTLLVFERVCDAIADGEADALGASSRRLTHLLEASMRGQ